MTLFKTSGELKSEVASLTADLESANTELETVRGELTACQSELATAREELAARPTADQVSKLESDLTSAQSAAAPEIIEAKAVELASAENPPEAIQKVIASRVTEELAGAGHDKPIASVEDDKSGKTMPRADFNNLSHPKRNAFIREGGKITN
jgi:chromosome segregation ATPase